MIISAIATKGGVGKSTLITNLASFFISKGMTACLIDTDQDNQTSSNWVDRSSYDIKSYSVKGSVEVASNKLGSQYDYVFIDIAGIDSLAMRSALLSSDIVLFPLQPTQPALETAEYLYDLVKQAREVGTKAQFKFLLNGCSTHYLDHTVLEAIEYLKEFEDEIETLKSRIFHREDYKKAIRDGVGVISYKNTKASNEIQNLVKELKI